MYSFIKNNSNKSHLGFNEFPSFFDDVLTREFYNKSQKSNSITAPLVNIKETERSFELELAAPGLDKKNFKLELVEDKLIISSVFETTTDEKIEEVSFTRKEFNYSSFSRSFILPEKLIEKELIAANYENGILKVSIPKKEVSAIKQNREIKIS